jgi:hypothetical protein
MNFKNNSVIEFFRKVPKTREPHQKRFSSNLLVLRFFREKMSNLNNLFKACEQKNSSLQIFI